MKATFLILCSVAIAQLLPPCISSPPNDGPVESGDNGDGVKDETESEGELTGSPDMESNGSEEPPGNGNTDTQRAISESFNLVFPFTSKNIQGELTLSNRDGEERSAFIEAVFTLEQQSDGDLEGELEISVGASIDGGQVQLALRYLDENGAVLLEDSSRRFYSSDSRVRSGTHFVFESESRVVGAKKVLVVLEAVDYGFCSDSCPKSEIPPSLNSTPTTHVFVLPGILGDGFRIQKMKEILESSQDEEGNPIEVRVWDWTEKWESREQSIQDRLYITQQTCEIGKEFADALKLWRSRSTNVRAIHLIGMSAGSMIAKGTCGATDGTSPVLGDEFFDKILLLSGALDIREPWDSLDTCSKDIFNYYSYADQIVATRFPSFLIFRIRISVAWPACGGVGLKQGSDSEAEHVSWQLPWIRRENGGRGEELGNRGGHLDPGCLAEDYFTEYILPIFTTSLDQWPTRQSGVSDGWDKDIHPEYMQDSTGWGLPDRHGPVCP
jgi:hypothetical protein